MNEIIIINQILFIIMELEAKYKQVDFNILEDNY